MWRITRWKNLQSRLNMNRLNGLCEDLNDLHINNLCISIPKYGISTHIFESRLHDYGEIQVSFEQVYKSATDHMLIMNAYLYLGKNVVEATIVGEAEYSELCDYYDANLQDYLFTYFANIISCDKYLTKFGNFSIPDKLSTYYPECDWSPNIKVSYHRDSRGEPLTVERVSGKKSVPLILRVGTNKKEEI